MKDLLSQPAKRGLNILSTVTIALLEALAICVLTFDRLSRTMLRQWRAISSRRLGGPPETDKERTGRVRIVAFNTEEDWSREVSPKVGDQIKAKVKSRWTCFRQSDCRIG